MGKLADITLSFTKCLNFMLTSLPASLKSPHFAFLKPNSFLFQLLTLFESFFMRTKIGKNILILFCAKIYLQ